MVSNLSPGQESVHVPVLSDSHLTAPNPENQSYYPHYVATLSKIEQQQFMQEIHDVTRHAFHACLQHIATTIKPRFLVHDGDITGGSREQGMQHDMLAEGIEAKKAMNDVAQPYAVLGNHDLGYEKRSTLEQAGITREALENCINVFNDPYWQREDAGIVSLGIATPLEEYDGPEKYIQNWRDWQREFVQATLAEHAGKPWVLYAHDPFEMGRLSTIMEPHRQDFQTLIHGDLHSPVLGGILKRAKLLPGIRSHLKIDDMTREMASKSYLCPSTAPFSWRGYEYLHATYGDQGVSVQRTRVPIAEDAPTSRAARSKLMHGYFVYAKLKNKLWGKKETA